MAGSQRLIAATSAGMVAGCVAAAVMSAFQACLIKLAPPAAREDSPAVKMVQAAIGRRLSRGEKPVANQAVHYASGAMLGAIYGVLAEVWPGATAGVGAAYGVATFLVIDEGLVPAAGFSGGPGRYPASIHARSLASHVVYGLALEVVRRLTQPAAGR